MYRCVRGQRNAKDLRDMEPSTSSSGNMHFQDPLAPAVIELILENQRFMLETQNEIMQTLNEYSDKLDSLSSVSGQSENLCIPTSLNEENSFTPIDSKQELDRFEQDLKDPEQKNALYKKFVGFCQGQGEHCPYFLIDLLFSRMFMTRCSWTGGSRGDVKVPFKAYNNTIKFIQQVIYSCDTTFSMFECHKFLKVVLRNSVQRLESKGMRASHRRKRRKRFHLSYTNNIDSGDEYDESGDHIESSHNSQKRSSGEMEMSDAEVNDDNRNEA